MRGMIILLLPSFLLPPWFMMRDAYTFEAADIHGETRSLEQYRGTVSLIVNTASKCGFTPQYKGLQALYDALHDQGFNVLGFPCNQFGKQEPGSAEEIETFCSTKFNVTFPLFDKIDVNGPNAHPLFQFLKSAQPGILGSEGIKWNFTKFLVDKDGNVIKRYAPKTTPDAIRSDIEALL